MGYEKRKVAGRGRWEFGSRRTPDWPSGIPLGNTGNLATPDPCPVCTPPPPHPTASSDDGLRVPAAPSPARTFHVASADALLPVCISSQNRKKKLVQFFYVIFFFNVFDESVLLRWELKLYLHFS